MNCPVCDNVKMREVDKGSVTVDICPQCKGVWLDRGELDKLMSGVKEARDDFNAWQQERYGDDDHERYNERDRSYHADKHSPHYGKKKKRSFLDSLGDIFD